MDSVSEREMKSIHYSRVHRSSGRLDIRLSVRQHCTTRCAVIAESSPRFDSLAYISLSKFPAPTAAAPKRLNPATTNDEAARCTDRSMLSGRPNTDGCNIETRTKCRKKPRRNSLCIKGARSVSPVRLRMGKQGRRLRNIGKQYCRAGKLTFSVQLQEWTVGRAPF